MAEITFEAPNGAVSSIVFDATVEELHESSAVITEHPVETGSNVTDHVRPDPDRVTLEAMISNHPIRQPGDSWTDGAIGVVSEAGVFVQSPPARLSPAQLTNPGVSPTPDFFPPSVPGVRALVKTLVPGVRPEWTASPLVEGTPFGATVSVLQFSGEFDRAQIVYGLLVALQRTGTLVNILTTLREYDNMILETISTPRNALVGRHAIQFGITARQVRLVTSETVSAPEPEELRGNPRANRGNKGADTGDDNEGSNASLWYRASEALGLFG